MHLAMQQININKTSSIEEIRNEISRMIIEEFITEEAAREVRINKIYNFFKSTLGKRVKAASHIKRETPFYIEVNSTDIYKDLSKDIYGGEKVILQGVIDLYFEEEDGLVLIDYKTDYVEDIEDIKKKYFMQLKYYKEALERITGKKVKEKFLYLFHIDDFIEI